MTRAMRAHGFSIVEMLVALALSAMLLAGVVATFLGSRSSYAAAERLSQIHEKGRYALDEMIRDVRGAGFRGCARDQPVVTSSLRAERASPWDFLDAPIRGFQYAGGGQWLPALDHEHIPEAARGSDVLLVRGPIRSLESMRLLDAMTDDAAALETDAAAAAKLARGDVVLAHNCEARSYFMVSSVAEGTIEHRPLGETDLSSDNATASLGHAYAPPTELTAMQTAVYYVAPSRSPDASSSLWRRVGAGAPQELAAGVEQMQLQFGVDRSSDGVPDELVTADAVADWHAVRSVSVALLVHSGPGASRGDDVEEFQLLDVDIVASRDGRVRKAFVATASRRNSQTELMR